MRFPVLMLGFVSAAFLFSGCGIKKALDDSKAAQAKAKAKAEGKKKITEESDKIWAEAAKQKREGAQQGGIITMGDKSVEFSALTLEVGALKTAGDIDGGQEPSTFKSTNAGNPSIVLSPVPIESVNKVKKLAGQSYEVKPVSTESKIITADGTVWMFKDAFLNVTRVEGSIAFISIEGNVVDSAGENSVKITGELRAKVSIPGVKPEK